MPDPNESYQTAAGRVATRRFGDGRPDGPPLVLAHGWRGSSQAWHRILPALARQAGVHLYDMPEFDRSETDPEADTGLAAPARDRESA